LEKILRPLSVPISKSKRLKPKGTTKQARGSQEKIEEKGRRENPNNKRNKRNKNRLQQLKHLKRKKLMRNLLLSVREEEEEVVKVNSDQLF